MRDAVARILAGELVDDVVGSLLDEVFKKGLKRGIAGLAIAGMAAMGAGSSSKAPSHDAYKNPSFEQRVSKKLAQRAHRKHQTFKFTKDGTLRHIGGGIK